MDQLPEFLEAIERRLSDITSIEFNPNAEEARSFPDPECGWVAFKLGDSEQVIFRYRYRAGGEGTRGSLDKLERIEVRREMLLFIFYPFEHYCGCPHCPGLKYAFYPSPMIKDWRKFEEATEESRLQIIRQFVNLK